MDSDSKPLDNALLIKILKKGMASEKEEKTAPSYIWAFLASWTAALNLVDAIATYIFIHTGFAYEANPLMAALQHVGWKWFFVVKVLTSAACFLLPYMELKGANKAILCLAAAAYTLLCASHSVQAILLLP